MAFRLVRICETEENLENRLKELKDDFLIPRQYHPRVINAQFNRIRNLHGKDWKEENSGKEIKKNDGNHRIVAPMDYNPLLPKISELLEKHHKAMLFKKPELKENSRNLQWLP